MPPTRIPQKSNFLIALTGSQRAAVSKAAKGQSMTVSAYIRGLIDAHHPPANTVAERRMCKPTHEGTIRAKGSLDGAKTFTEIIERLNSQAIWYAQLRAEGVVLDGTVGDDYGVIATDSAEVAHKWGMHTIEPG